MTIPRGVLMFIRGTSDKVNYMIVDDLQRIIQKVKVAHNDYPKGMFLVTITALKFIVGAITAASVKHKCYIFTIITFYLNHC